jgi:hypothetical protein
VFWRATPYAVGLVLLALGVTHAVPKPFAAIAGVAGILLILGAALGSVAYGLRRGSLGDNRGTGTYGR